MFNSPRHHPPPPLRVVATGPSKNKALGYDWAIITGGRPSVATPRDTCLPPAATDDGCGAARAAPPCPACCAAPAHSNRPATRRPGPRRTPLLPPARSVWLFSRTPVAPAADVAAMMKAAKELRLDTASLVPVRQAGCTYAGAAP